MQCNQKRNKHLLVGNFPQHFEQYVSVVIDASASHLAKWFLLTGTSIAAAGGSSEKGTQIWPPARVAPIGGQGLQESNQWIANRCADKACLIFGALPTGIGETAAGTGGTDRSRRLHLDGISGEAWVRFRAMNKNLL